MTDRPSWALQLHRPEPRAVVLVLYGGKARSHEPSRGRHLSAARLVPVARLLHRELAAYDAEVRMVRYRFRGWNGEEASPAADARWALQEIRRERPGLPVVLVGHSMGGRAALRVGGDDGVVGVLGLAPWCEPGDPVEQLAGRRLRILHGRRDRWTDPRASRRLTERARQLGGDARWVDLGPTGHFMLRRYGRWSALTSYATGELLQEGGVGPSDRTAGAQRTNV